MRALVAFVGLVACTAALSSQPGQPLDCSDWVLLKPGLSCSVAEVLAASSFLSEGATQVADNEGNQLLLSLTRLGDCCSGCAAIYRLELVRFGGQTETGVASIDDRCNGDNLDIIEPTAGALGQFESRHMFVFDAVNGRLLIGARLKHCPGSQCAGIPAYPGLHVIVALNGFAPLLEIFQSYEPTAGPLSFTVPAMPGGFPAADYFDTYYGDLATVGDWSQAHPLQCGYPSTPPSIGDYLTVADPLPDPASGTGRYYVTAVTHQGQRRYGRKSTNGVLSGRDPNALPACE